MRFGDLTDLDEVCRACACPAYRCAYGLAGAPPAGVTADTPMAEVAARMRCRSCGRRPWQVAVFRLDRASRQPTEIWRWETAPPPPAGRAP